MILNAECVRRAGDVFEYDDNGVTASASAGGPCWAFTTPDFELHHQVEWTTDLRLGESWWTALGFALKLADERGLA